VRVFADRDPLSGRDRYVSRTVSAGSRREAEKEVALLVAEVASGRHTGTTSMTFGELLERWLALKRGNDLSPTTLTLYAAVIRNDLLPNLGTVKLNKLSALQLDSLYAGVADRAGPPMARKVHSVVRGALAQAKRWGLVTTNVASDASPPKQRKIEVQPPTVDELRVILDEASGDFRSLLHLAATSGARRGELLALRWSDMNLDGKRMTIRNNVVEVASVAVA
jgi:integrase